ncbi:MAG: TRAP transporter small permease [Tenacibaculum sp.]
MKILRKHINKCVEKILVVIMAFMVINVIWQVFSRYILNSPSSFTDELARYLMIWLGVMGAAYLSGRNAHVAIDIISARFGKKVKKRLASIVRILIITFVFLTFIVGGSKLVYITFTLKQYSPALQIPLALVYIVIPLSGFLIVYYKISDFFNTET